MPGRKFNTNAYRYGLNGQEMDNELNSIDGAYTSAEYWQYDARLGRRWNVDPISFAWQSPYDCFNDNPIYFEDPDGLEGEKPQISGPNDDCHVGDTYSDGTPVKGEKMSIDQINNSLSYLSYQQWQIEWLSKKIEQYEVAIQKMKDIQGEGIGWGLGSSYINPIASSIFFISDEVNDYDERIEQREYELQALYSIFEEVVGQYNLNLGDFKNHLNKTASISLGAGVVMTASNGVHLNSNLAVGDFALYEIEVDGEHYKFGVANANDVIKTDIELNGKNYKGVPRRIYVQARTLLKTYSSVEIKYEVHKNVTKYHIKQVETAKIMEEGEKRGWIGQGNKGHERIANLKKLFRNIIKARE
jgi:hypothetical protein